MTQHGADPAFLLHLWRNWRPFKLYLRHLPMAVAFGLSLVAGALLLLPGNGTGGMYGPPAPRARAIRP